MAGEKILIVDDEKSMCQYLSIMLKKEGYKVKTASNGLKAVKEVSDSNFDVVITDIRMPGMDGPATLGEVRKRWPEIPVTIITAYGESALMERALDYTPFTVVKKPFTFEKLLQAVQVGLLSRQVGDWPWRKGGYHHRDHRGKSK